MNNYFAPLFDFILNLKNSSCQSKVKYLNKRIETLTASIATSIIAIDITPEPKTTIEPWRLIDSVVADGKYCTFTLSDWRPILLGIQTQLKDRCNWTEEIFDCDDFALLFSAILSYSSYKSGLKIQPAFAIAWSGIHAFNLFITDKNEIYIFEPQNNVFMTLEEGRKDPMYDVKKAWFMS